MKRRTPFATSRTISTQNASKNSASTTKTMHLFATVSFFIVPTEPSHDACQSHLTPRVSAVQIRPLPTSDPAVVEAVGRVARRHGAVACYRMGSGQGLRVHRDDYFGGGLSATLYLSPWRWDWGGVLYVLSEDGVECSVVYPEENACAYVDHVPHFVSRVEGRTTRPRYTVNVFGILEI